METDKGTVHELDLHGKKLLTLKGINEVSLNSMKINYWALQVANTCYVQAINRMESLDK